MKFIITGLTVLTDVRVFLKVYLHFHALWPLKGTNVRKVIIITTVPTGKYTHLPVTAFKGKSFTITVMKNG